MLHKLLTILFFKYYSHNKYLQKSSVSRVCAVGGFFISIPIFLTGKIEAIILKQETLFNMSYF